MKNLLSALLILTSSLFTYCQTSYLEKGNYFLNNGEFEKAKQIFKAGVDAEPQNLIYQCQLGLTLIQLKDYSNAEKILEQVIQIDSNNVAAIWYSGIGNYEGGKDRKAIGRFEKVLTLISKSSEQFYSANWFIGKSYSILLKTEGLTFRETDRMFECYEEYLRLQPNADDAAQIRDYIERKKKRRPSNNVKKWVDM